MKDGNPGSTESTGQWGLSICKLPHPVLPVRQERAELFTHKHPGTKPPLQGKGGKKSNQKEHEKLIGF